MGGMSGLLSSCLSPLILLGLLFLVGLSACGAPVILLVPLFYGLGLGMTEAYYYSTGAAGIGAVSYTHLYSSTDAPLFSIFDFLE